MKAELLSVGTELLLGNILNTNAEYLSKEIASLGFYMYWQTTVGDNFERVVEAVTTAINRSDIVIMTGGLGPTPDDLSKEAAAAALGLELSLDDESLESIREYYRTTGRKMSDSNIKQALFPKENCVIFKNFNGTAPGCMMKAKNGSMVFLMPGVPFEMKKMFEGQIKPYLSKLSDKVLVSKNVLIAGIGESYLASMIPDIIDSKDPTVSPYCKPGLVTLRVTSSAEDTEGAEAKCSAMVKRITDIFGENVCGVDVGTLENAVVGLLKEKGLKAAIAESCTAGKVSAAITSVPGASSVFDFGASTYSNEMKQKLLKVPAEVIEEHGAVSPETAIYMAKGIREFAGADVGLSLTGVAGPGCSENKPVGLVYIGLADKEHVWVEKLTVGKAANDREKVRNNAVSTALDLLRRYLVKYPSPFPGMTDVMSPVLLIPEDLALSTINTEDI